MDTKKKKIRSFAGRLSRRIILVMLLVNVFTIGAVLLFVVFGMMRQNGEHFSFTMDYTGEKLETMLTAVEVTAVNNVAEVEAHLQQPDMVYAALEKELKLNTHVVGCFAAFDPDYFPDKGRWFEPYVVRRDSSRMEKMQLGSALHDYLQKEWFKKGHEADNGYWSDPYYDDVGAYAMLCSYVLPLHDQQGRTVGVFGVDLPLDWLKETLQNIEDKENSSIFGKTDNLDDDKVIYSFIIGRNGAYIVHPDKTRILEENFLSDVEQTPDTLDNYMCREMLAGRNGSLLMNFNGVSSFVFYEQLGHAGWSMAIVVPMYTMLFWGVVISIIVLVVMLLGLLAVFLISRISIRKVARPLHYLNESAREVAKGNFDTPLPLFKHNDEISQLRDSFEIMQQSLSQYMDELKRTTISKTSMESELRIAHSIQMSMLPKDFPAFPDRNDIDIYGLVAPAKAVGGDLYDFFIRDEKLFFCVGDVSGKGVPASLVMAVTRSLFRNISSHVAKPGQIVMTLNDSLSEGNDANMFVTLFVGVLDLPTGRLHYCNAGHEAPVVIQPSQPTGNVSPAQPPSGNHCLLLDVIPNLPLGVMPGKDFPEQEIMVSPGTTIFLYTDGLNEAEDADFKQFGKERILQVATSSTNTPQPLVKAIVEAVHQFVGDTEQSDDLTMLAVQYTWERLADYFERSITLSNDVQQVPQLAAFVDEVCEGVGLDMMEAMQMNLAMEEAVVNVMKYAYPSGVSGNVHIRAVANEARLKFIITDEGVPFDPTAHGEVDTTLSAEERNIGGLGIHLVRNIMDTINYERVDGKNVFTLRKKLK